MNTHRITRALAALVVAGALVSCAADAEPPASDRDRTSKKARDTKADRKDAGEERRSDSSAKSPTAGAGAKTGSAVKARGSSAGPGDDGPGAASQGPEPLLLEFPEPTCLDDASGDTDRAGSTPAYVDLTGACLQPRAEQLVLGVTAAGVIPDRMPDEDTHATYGFELEPAKGSDLYVFAEADANGWSAHVTRDGEQQALASPVINDNRLTISLPITELGDARSWQWLVESSFLKSGLLTTNYAFDTAPNAGTARFDR